MMSLMALGTNQAEENPNKDSRVQKHMNLKQFNFLVLQQKYYIFCLLSVCICRFYYASTVYDIFRPMLFSTPLFIILDPPRNYSRPPFLTWRKLEVRDLSISNVSTGILSTLKSLTPWAAKKSLMLFVTRMVISTIANKKADLRRAITTNLQKND